MLYLIGIGLNDEKDITVKGLEAVRRCSKVYLESYTSKFQAGIGRLSQYYGKEVIIADRNLIENQADIILDQAKSTDIAILIIGDVFGATTHSDIYLRAKEKGLDISVINNTSIINAVGIVGLELYKYGRIASLPFFEESYKPATPYSVISDNLSHSLHTLVLLDIRHDQDRYMTASQAMKQLLELEDEKHEGIILQETRIIACSRIGSEDSLIKYGAVKDLISLDFGKPLHCLIIPSKLHFIEEQMLDTYSIYNSV
jgi:diphthine methyl ester synthase